MKTVILKMVCTCLLVTGLQFPVVAQPEDNGGDPPPSDVPLDGSTSLLIAAGVAFGVKQMRNIRTSKKRRMHRR